MFLWIFRGRKPTRWLSKKSGTLPLASTSMTRTFLPCCAPSSASAAEVVLLPTPPLPVSRTTRRLSRSSISDSVAGIPRVYWRPRRGPAASWGLLLQRHPDQPGRHSQRVAAAVQELQRLAVGGRRPPPADHRAVGVEL